jgi:hypothetical protein
MEKTSRRNFGKLIAGAVATLPLVSCSGPTGTESTQSGAQGTPPATAASKEASQHKRHHQDTPPSLILEEGSLKVDLMDPTLESTEELPKTGNVYKWEYPGATSDIFIVGAQIVSGAGRVLFFLNRENVDNEEKWPLHIRVHMETEAGNRKELVVATDGRHVTFTVPPSRRLRRKRLVSGGPFEPGNAGRVRFRYFDDGGAENWKLESVAVGVGPTGANRVVTRYDRENLDEAITGTQVMLWFDEV